MRRHRQRLPRAHLLGDARHDIDGRLVAASPFTHGIALGRPVGLEQIDLAPKSAPTGRFGEEPQVERDADDLSLSVRQLVPGDADTHENLVDLIVGEGSEVDGHGVLAISHPSESRVRAEVERAAGE